MLINNLNIKNFTKKKIKTSKKKKINQILKSLFSEKKQVILSLSENYKDSYTKKFLKKIKKYKFINLIGMGGSILGARAINSFIRSKLKINFIDEYQSRLNKKNLDKNLNLIISKSGNTLETVANSK